jgi:hypothetical protein
MPYFGVPIRNGLPIGLGTLTALAQAVAGVVPPPVSSDPYFEYVTLLTNTNETNGAQNNTFLDSSTNAFSITRNGNTTQGTFSPFSQTGWSNYFDGTGDYLTAPNNTAFDFGTGDFTVEVWVSFTATGAGVQTLVTNYTGATTGWNLQWRGTGVGWAFGNGDTVLISYLDTPPINTWTHFAVSRSGTSLRLFVNGALVSSVTNSTNITGSTNPLAIGALLSGSYIQFVTGYLSNVRVVKGTAVYTAAFTPPTAPLTNITNTSLLTCQSNRFIDTSSNAFAITRNGDVSVQAFSPFNPTAAWSAGTNGGSGYFDGTGDYLSVPRNNAFLPVANEDFTFEAWVYLTATPGATEAQILGLGEYGTDADWFLGINSSLQVGLYLNSTLTFYRNTNTALTLNSWNHVAASRSGTGSNNLKVYVNGVGQSFTTNATTIFSGNRDITIGADQNGDESNLTGYISNARIVKGTAVYTANFTPPTAPLTAITNTSLLCNFTNAGIFDSASGNDLETVGNAQVSTTVAKWGTTSMAFDGTGDWLVAPDRPPLRFGTGAFTIEGWFYSQSFPPVSLLGKGTSTTGWNVGIDSSGYLAFIHGSTTITGSTTATSTSVWQHFAIVRTGTGTNQTSIYLNGTLVGQGTVATDFNQTNLLYMGASRVANEPYTGYIDDLRITNGYARYTANFTPPTAAFPLQ